MITSEIYETSVAAKTIAEVSLVEGRYHAKLADSPAEIESALRLRYDVFKRGGSTETNPVDRTQLEFDEYDSRCRHLIVVDRTTGTTVGTYRLNSIESALDVTGFYSNNEFTLEELPREVVERGVEIGRACIAADHRNTKVLFLLWKGMAAYIEMTSKQFFFGCCSIFTRDVRVGEQAYRHLISAGHFHERFRVEPRRNALYLASRHDDAQSVELPNLFNMYLRIGAKVCGPPMIDEDFGTIDFFVVCDITKINAKYRRMFFS